MNTDFAAAKSIFLSAVDKPAAEQPAYLDQACGGDAELRRQVEALLKAHEAAGSFLARLPAADDETLPPRPPAEGGPPAGSPAEQPGTVIAGRYKLMQELGEGGMGTVWVAEQEQPVKRRVALKVIKSGVSSTQVLRRFEAERQALALMDHPNIARIFDAGATPAGQPFFVMELIRGVPITKYCDELQLPVRERLQLFVPVCQAIQHAHQKGVIHRDIKPSNVLVAVQDGVPVPKVIDFGVAKSIDQPLGERTMHTEIGALVGTLEYMSPEQAELSALDVDTRADIYALGVLLYELLTGTTPLNRRQLQQAAIFEMLRAIKEDEPPRPSTRLSESKATLAELAARRRTEPARLTREVRGELDWIVMKSLEKDRTRRYDSASSLSRDVERYLTDEPVEAGPPSARYRLRKWLRRNRAAVTVALVIWGITLAASGFSWRQQQIAQDARRQAENDAAAARIAQAAAEKAQQAEARERSKAQKQKDIAEAVKGFLEHDLIGQADPLKQALFGKPAPDLKLVDAIDRAGKGIGDRFKDQPLIEASVRQAVAAAYESLGRYADARQHLERAGELYRGALSRGDEDDRAIAEEGYIEALMLLANTHIEQGHIKQGVAVYRKALDQMRPLFGDDPAKLAALEAMVKAIEENDVRKAIDQNRANLKEVGHLPPIPNASGVQARLQSASEALSQRMEVLGHFADGNYPRAEAGLKQLLEQGRSKSAPEFTDLSLWGLLGEVYRRQGKDADALSAFETAREGLKKSLPADHPVVGQVDGGIGHVLLAQGKFAAAEAELRSALVVYAKHTPEHPDHFHVKSLLGAALAGQKKFAEAEPLLTAGYEGLKGRTADIPKHDLPRVADAAVRLVEFYDATGKPAEAAKWRVEVEAARKAAGNVPGK